MGTNLASRVDNFPDSWLPEPGDKIVGEIVDLTTNDGGYGPYKIVTVVVEDLSTEQGGNVIGLGEERAWHCFDTVSKNELAKQKPQLGDGIAAKFFGMRPGKDGTEYKAWRVIVEHRGKRSGGEVEAVEEADAAIADVAETDDIPF